MVTQPIWYTVTTSHWGHLCMFCLEHRLGRHLTPDDLTDAPINVRFFERHALRGIDQDNPRWAMEDELYDEELFAQLTANRERQDAPSPTPRPKLPRVVRRRLGRE
jgi:hypothetical protein